MVCVSVPVAAEAATATVGATAAETAFLASATAASGITAGAATAGSFASTLATAGTIASLVGTGISGIGAIQQGRAGAESAKYNASVAMANQQIAEQNSTHAQQAGDEQVAEQQDKTRAEVGQLTSNAAASGLDVDSGSEANVLQSATEIGQLNALTIRANATQQAYGYNNQATSYGSEAQIDKSTAGNDTTAGYLSSGSTVLSGLGNSALTYGKYLSNNSAF